MGAFSEAVDARDMDAVEAMLADDVVFRSPVAFEAYPGMALTNAILRSVIEVFEDFHYVREIDDNTKHAWSSRPRSMAWSSLVPTSLSTTTTGRSSTSW